MKRNYLWLFAGILFIGGFVGTKVEAAPVIDAWRVDSESGIIEEGTDVMLLLRAHNDGLYITCDISSPTGDAIVGREDRAGSTNISLNNVGGGVYRFYRAVGASPVTLNEWIRVRPSGRGNAIGQARYSVSCRGGVNGSGESAPIEPDIRIGVDGSITFNGLGFEPMAWDCYGVRNGCCRSSGRFTSTKPITNCSFTYSGPAPDTNAPFGTGWSTAYTSNMEFTISGAAFQNGIGDFGTITVTCLGIFGTRIERSGPVGCQSVPPPPPPAPTLTFTADNYNLPENGSTTLRWTSTNAVGCSASRNPAGGTWTGAKGSTSGQNYTESTGALASGSYTYNLSCWNIAGVVTSQSFMISVNQTPPPNPANLQAVCLAPNQVRLSWDPVPGALLYPLRINDTTTGWGPSEGRPCDFYPGDECVNVIANSYVRSVVPGRNYGWWVHAWNAGGWSPGIGGADFRCDYPPSIIRGRITNQATGAGISGVTFTTTCGVPPHPIPPPTDVNGDYSFTVPYDARFCIRPNTPSGMMATPLLPGLWPSQQAGTATYEWQVAGWNAGDPACVNSSIAPCDPWKQWDRAVDNGYDFVYSPTPPPTVTLYLDPSTINIHPSAPQSSTLTWSATGNVTSCSATSGPGFVGSVPAGVFSGTKSVKPDTVGVYPYVVSCTGPGGTGQASRDLTVQSSCVSDLTCGGIRATTCTDRKCSDGCGGLLPGTKDCRGFWTEPAP